MIRNLLVIMMLGACSAPAPTRPETPPMQHSSTWSIRYHDGSGNGYRFWQDGDGAHFEYTPVTPAMSSSGTYSGGEPARGSMTADQVRDLRARIDALRTNRDLHTEAREMGTGSFSLDGEEFLIRRGAELAEFDAALAPYR